MSQRDALAELLADCHDDPGLFHEVFLGRPALHPKQEQIARSVCRNRVTVVPAAHAVGKSWYAATAALHWLYTRPGAKVITTSASNNQLVSVLWAAIKGAHARAPVSLAGAISDGNAIPQRLQIAPEWYAIGFSAKKPESFAGFHGDNILVIVDESSGVEQGVWDAIESLGFTALLALGNPIRATGHFRRLWELATSGEPGYAGFHLTAFDSPHAHLTDEEVQAAGLPRGLTTRTWIDSVRRTYGEGSLYWLTRVLARFPDEDVEQLLTEAWVDRCVLVARQGPRPGMPTAPALALDVSKGTGRDRTAIIVGDYLGIREIIADNRIELLAAAALAVEVGRRHGVPHHQIVFDAGGWAGKDMLRYLNQYGINGAVPYYGNGKGGSLHKNLRSRAAWRLRQRLDPDRPLFTRPVPHQVGQEALHRRRVTPVRVEIQPPFHVPPSPHWGDLRQELLELRYRHDGPKIELEKKEDLVQRLGRSPDLGDTFLMLASLWPQDDY